MKYIGDAISKRRKELGLTQNNLAKIVGISANALCSIEKGKTIPSPSTYDKIFSALKVKPVVTLVDMRIDFRETIDAISRLTDVMKGFFDAIEGVSSQGGGAFLMADKDAESPEEQ